jgi:hypothetical protein
MEYMRAVRSILNALTGLIASGNELINLLVNDRTRRK